MEKNKKITKNMLIEEVVLKHPDVAPIFFAYGLHCVGCHISSMETIEEGARAHGMDDEDINMIIKDANKIISKNIK